MKALPYNLRLIAVVAISVAALLAASLFIGARSSYGKITLEQPSQSDNYQIYNFFYSSSTSQESGLQATTTSATSTNVASWIDSNGRIDRGYMVIAGAEKVNFYFSRGDTTGQGNSGSSKFRVQVSPDGTNWYYWGKWIENASSSAGFAPLAYSGTDFTVTGTSTKSASMVLDNDSFYAVRCIVDETTDGEHKCEAAATW